MQTASKDVFAGPSLTVGTCGLILLKTSKERETVPHEEEAKVLIHQLYPTLLGKGAHVGTFSP